MQRATEPAVVTCFGSDLSGDTTLSDTPRFISNGGTFACGGMPDGTVECWGRGRRGELGDGLFTDSDVPVLASATSVAALDLGRDYACFVSSGTTTVKCWGFRGANALGDGVPWYRAAPGLYARP